MNRRTFSRNIAVAGAAAALSPFAIVRAQAQKLRVGVLLPRSGIQAFIGQDVPDGRRPRRRRAAGNARRRRSSIMNADTESNVDTAAHAGRAPDPGGRAAFWSAPFDSGQTTAIAQVAEQRGIPLVINIAAAPQITEQGYKFVFRNFQTAPTSCGDGFAD